MFVLPAGYFARFCGIDTILRRFLAVTAASSPSSSSEAGKRKAQIVSLGAGFDSSFFRLTNNGALNTDTLFVEVDFPDVTLRKAALIRRHAALLALIGGRSKLTREEMEAVEAAAMANSSKGGDSGFLGGGGGRRGAGGLSSPSSASSSSEAEAPLPPIPEGVFIAAEGTSGTVVSGPNYRLVTADLRQISSLSAALLGPSSSSSSSETSSSSSGDSSLLDPSVPTLFLSECVLVYLEPEESCAIIAFAAQSFPRSVFVTYEQIRPHDAFGAIMARNLAERGYTLRGLNAFPDLAAQKKRYRELGFRWSCCWDLNDCYYRLLPTDEVKRTERLELFDEVEEWHLMSAHYCIAVAVNELPGFAGAGGEGGGDAVESSSSMPPASSPVPPLRPAASSSSSSSAEGAMTSPSPREIAVAVVHAHEQHEAAEHHHGSGSGSGGGLFGSPRIAAAVGSPGPGPGAGAASLKATADAISEASGTKVESVEAPTSPASASGLRKTGEAGTILGGGPGSPGTIHSLHTHAGEVVIASRGQVDFGAIAEAQEELRQAAKMRATEGKALNLEVQRARSGSLTSPDSPVLAHVQAAMKAAGSGSGGGAGGAVAAGAAAAGGRRGSGAGFHLAHRRGSGTAPAPMAAAGSYSIDDLKAKIKSTGPASVSLRDLLFPGSLQEQ